MPDPQTPPFVIGVTGHMKLDSQNVEMKKRVRLLFRFLKMGANAPDPEDDSKTLLTSLLDAAGSEARVGYAEGLGAWRGLEYTPILVLSSLAPGADTLVADVALEKEFKGAGFYLKAPLSFPEDLYRDATTFCWHDAPPEDNARRQLVYDEKSGALQPEDRFAVLLEADQHLSPDDRRRQFEDDMRVPERRRLRYRAAGEYIAVFSHLLIAIWDKGEEPETAAGTGAIVHARRNGLAPGILSTAATLALADSGPVVHLRFDMTTGTPGEAGVRFLHPIGSRPKVDLPDDDDDDDDPEWQSNRLAAFCRIAANLDGFNRTSTVDAAHVDEEMKSRIWYQPAGGEEQDFSEPLRQASPELHAGLRGIMALRRRAGKANETHAEAAASALASLFWLSFFAAAFIHLFAHWHPQDDSHWGRPLLGGMALLFALLAILRFWQHAPEQSAERAHDYRALAEGLRVQLAWNLAGLGLSVPANYMLRQRSELDWIRGAINAAAFPYERWRGWFDRLDREHQTSALRCVATVWVADQAHWFDTSAERCHRALHFWHTLSGVLAIAGIIVFAALVAFTADVVTSEALARQCRYVLVVAILGELVCVVAGRGHGSKAGWDYRRLLLRLVPTHDLRSTPPATRIAHRGWSLLNFCSHLPLAVLVAALVLLASEALGRFGFFPKFGDLGIIAGGYLVLASALTVAWAEKNSFSELAYQYNTMAVLFRTAQARLEASIEQLGGLDSTAFKTARAEIQQLLAVIGKEALDENADWLMLHRSRPLEPVMAG